MLPYILKDLAGILIKGLADGSYRPICKPPIR